MAGYGAGAAAPAASGMGDGHPQPAPHAAGAYGGGARVESRFMSRRLQQKGLEEAMEKGEDFSGPWKEPSKAVAEEKRLAKMFKRGKGSWCGTSLDEDIQTLGVGMDLYFRLLKYLSILFTLLTILALPVMFFSLSGSRFTEDQMDPLGLAVLTLGNNGLEPVALRPGEPEPNVTKTVYFGTEVSSKDISGLISAFDFLQTLVFIMFIVFFRARIETLTHEVDDDFVTSTDYAVFVKGLPSDAKKDEILNHFNNLYALDKDDFYHDGGCGCLHLGRKKVRGPVKDTSGRQLMPALSTSNTGDDRYLRKWVVEVSLARKNGKGIRKFLAQRTLYKRITMAKATVQRYSPQSTATADEGKLASAMGKLTKLERKLQKINEKHYGYATSGCEGAFVTFEYPVSQERCLHDYHRYNHWWMGCFTPPQLLFRGKRMLKVEQAPDPSNVIWENIEVSPLERRIRRYLMNLIMTVLLIVSLVLLFRAQVAKETFQSRLPTLSTCSNDLPWQAYGRNLTFPESTGIRRGTRDQDAACDAASPGKFWLEIYDTAAPDLVVEPLEGELANCTSTCVKPVGDETFCLSADGKSAYSMSSVASCFCIAVLQENIAALGVIDGANQAKADHADICTAVAADFLAANSLLVGAAVAVVAINALLKALATAMGQFERHDTISGRSTSVTLKVFAAIILNTAVIVVLVNARLPNNNDFPIQGIGLFEGQHQGFEAAWYPTVGVSICITMLVQAFVPHGAPLAQFLVLGPCRRNCLASRSDSQEVLNSNFTPPKFAMEMRYPYILNTLFAVMAYSTGLPLLLPIAVLTYLLAYWLDKLLLLRMYERPDRYDNSMAQLTHSLLRVAVLVHLGMAIYILGDDDVLKSDVINSSMLGSSGQSAEQAYNDWKAGVEQWDTIALFPKLVRNNVFPHAFLIVLLLIFNLVVGNAWSVVRRVLATVFHVLTCGKCHGAEVKLDMSDQHSAFLRTQPFTGTYEVLIPLMQSDFKGGKPFAGSRRVGPAGSGDPAAVQAANKYVDEQCRKALTEDDIAHGMGVMKKPAADGSGRIVQAVKVRLWQDDDEIDGVQHVKGQKMKTWQVVQYELGNHSFDIMRNPKYRRAVFGMQQAAKAMTPRGAASTPAAKAAAGPAGAAQSPLMIAEGV